MGATAQAGGVRYDSPLRDWRPYRFDDPELFIGTAAPRGRALGLAGARADRLRRRPRLARRRGGAHAPGRWHDRPRPGARARPAGPGRHGADPAATGAGPRPGGVPRRQPPAAASPAEHADVLNLVDGIATIRGVWAAMRANTAPPMRRDTVGPMRDFDYNLDGLAHYGLLPDMLQDLRNVGLPRTRWPRCSVRRAVHRGLGAQRRDRRPDPALMPGGSALMPSWYVHIQAAAETMERLQRRGSGRLAADPGRGRRAVRRRPRQPQLPRRRRPGPGPVLPAAGLQGRHGQGPARPRGLRAHDVEGHRRQLHHPVGDSGWPPCWTTQNQLANAVSGGMLGEVGQVLNLLNGEHRQPRARDRRPDAGRVRPHVERHADRVRRQHRSSGRTCSTTGRPTSSPGGCTRTPCTPTR